MIEFHHVVSQPEVSGLYLDLKKEMGTLRAALFPHDSVKLAIVDGRGRMTFADKFASAKLFNVGDWFRGNHVSLGTVVAVRFDPGEKIYGCPTLHLVVGPNRVSLDAVARRQAFVDMAQKATSKLAEARAARRETHSAASASSASPGSTNAVQPGPPQQAPEKGEAPTVSHRFAAQAKPFVPAIRAPERPTSPGSIEFRHVISEAEVRYKYFILRDETGRAFGEMLNGRDGRVAIVDGQGRVVLGSKNNPAAPNQITGGVSKWFRHNGIEVGTRVLVKCEPSERTQGCATIHLIPMVEGTMTLEEKGSWQQAAVAQAEMEATAFARARLIRDGDPWAMKAACEALQSLGGTSTTGEILRWIRDNWFIVGSHWKQEVTSAIQNNADGRGLRLFESIPNRLAEWRLAARETGVPLEEEQRQLGARATRGATELTDQPRNMDWIAMIVAALSALGRQAYTTSILREIERVHQALPPGWQRKIVETIEDHAGEAGEGLFDMTLNGLGWRLVRQPRRITGNHTTTSREEPGNEPRVRGNEARKLRQLIGKAAAGRGRSGMSAIENYLLALAAYELDWPDRVVTLMDLALANGLPARYRLKAERLHSACSTKTGRGV